MTIDDANAFLVPYSTPKVTKESCISFSCLDFKVMGFGHAYGRNEIMKSTILKLRCLLDSFTVSFGAEVSFRFYHQFKC